MFLRKNKFILLFGFFISIIVLCNYQFFKIEYLKFNGFQVFENHSIKYSNFNNYTGDFENPKYSNSINSLTNIILLNGRNSTFESMRSGTDYTRNLFTELESFSNNNNFNFIFFEIGADLYNLGNLNSNQIDLNRLELFLKSLNEKNKNILIGMSYGGIISEYISNFYPKIKKMPAWSRKTLQSLCSGIDPLWLERNSHRIPILKNYKNISNKFPKLLNALASENSLDFFNRASSYISQDDLRKLYPHYVPRFSTNTAPKNDQMISYWGMVDIQTYLEGDILTKVDRATMAVALEGRDPFLDHKIVEFSLKLSDHHKIRQQTTKYLLRKILYKYVPQKLIERPKQGFSIPVQQWLMHSLKDSLLALSSDQDFIQCFEFNSLELQQIIQNFLKQRQYINPHFIWFLYTLYQWYLRWIKK